MDRSTEPRSEAMLDRIAIALSGLCMLHCIALPVVLLLVPVIEEAAADHYHVQVLVFVLPVSIIALLLGYRRHRHAGTVIWGTVGLLMLIIGATWAHNQFGVVVDRIFTVGGSIVLAVTHYINSRLGRRHQPTGRCAS